MKNQNETIHQGNSHESLKMISWGLLMVALVSRSPPVMNGGGMQAENTRNSSQQGDPALPTVIVVGAGLAGLAASLGLANTGKFRVDLVELRPDFNRRGSSFGLAPNGINALEELDPNGVMSTLFPLGIDACQGIRQAWLFGWWMVRNALLERVQAKSDKIRLHMGYTVQDIVDEPGTSHLQATFIPSWITNRESSSSEKLALEGCLLVAADGVHSSIRKYLNRPPEQDVGATVWRGSITVDPSNPGDADPAQHERLMPLLEKGVLPLGGVRNFGPTAVVMFNYHSKRPGTLTWTVSFKSTDVTAQTNVWTSALEPFVDNEDDRKLLQAMLALSDPDDVWNPITYCVMKPPAENGNGWGGTGRVILIGDAAHALRAATGQGGNMAFEDAVVLCRALRASSQQQGFMEYNQMAELVAQVENKRLPRVKKGLGYGTSTSGANVCGQPRFVVDC